MMLSQAQGYVTTTWAENHQLIRRWLLVLATVLAVGVAFWKYASMPTTLRVAVGPAGSDREVFLKSIAKAFSEGRKSVRLKLVPVGDSAEAARLLDADKVDLAVVRSDEAKIADARSFAVLDRRAIVLVMRSETASLSKAKKPTAKAKDADAEDEAEPVSPSQLSGKRIVVVADGAGSNQALVARILAHSGLGKDAVTLSELPLDQVASAMASDAVDVAALVTVPTAPGTRKLIADISAKLSGGMTLGAPPSPEGLAAIYRDLVVVNLVPGVFGGLQPLPAQKLTTVAVTEELVGDSDMAEATGSQLSKALLEARGRLSVQSSPLGIEKPPTDALRRFMPHSGVTASEESKSFLETYSDQIWLSLFAIGLLGSSLAGLAGWLGLSRAPPVSQVPEQVLGLIGALDNATTVDDVDALRRRLREIVRTGLRETISETASSVDATHPSHWYPLVDDLAQRRRDELAGG